MKQAKTSLVTVKLGKEGDPTDCEVTVSSADSKGRHFVRLDAVNRDLATFYTTITIDDLVAGAPKSYLSAFNLVEASEIESGATGVSPELKSQWAKLPTPLRNWILAR